MLLQQILVLYDRGRLLLAGAADASVYVYHTGSGKVVAKLIGHHKINVRDISYDSISNRLASCSFDKTVKVYCCSKPE